MNGRAMLRALSFLSQLGLAYALAIPATEIAVMGILHTGRRASAHFLEMGLRNALTMGTFFAVIWWMTIGRLSARLLLSAAELRIPDIARRVGFCLPVLASVTIAGVFTPIVVAGGSLNPWPLWLASVVYAMLLGLLIPLLGGTRWMLLFIPLWCGLYLVMPWPFDGFQKILAWPMVAGMACLLVWRLRAITGAIGAGPPSDSIRYVMEFGTTSNPVSAWGFGRRQAGGKSASGHMAPAHPPAGAFRIVLGPIYKSAERAVLIMLVVIPPVLAGLLSRNALLVVVPLAATMPVFLACTFFIKRTLRLADFLWAPSGEITELALLPGLGDRHAQRHALLREALSRPLAVYGASVAAVIASLSSAAWLGHLPLRYMLTLAAVGGTLLLAFAMMTVGLLSGSLTRSSRRFAGAPYMLAPVMLIASLPLEDACKAGLFCAQESLFGLSSGQVVLCVTLPAAFGVGLAVWGARLSRRQDLLRV